jgi:peptidoglycan-N-acetylglucosamine deacetylase
MSGRSGAAPLALRNTGSLWGFVAPWDTRRDSTARADAPRLDVIVGGWMQLDSITGEPTQLYPDDPTRGLATSSRIALVTTRSGHSGDRFHPEAVRALASSTSALNLAASRLAALIARDGYSGALLDLEEQPKADLPSTLRVLRTIADTLHRRGLHIGVEIPGPDTAAYPTGAFAAIVDFLAIKLFDEHWPTSAPGPIASPAWVRRTLSRRVADVGAERIVAVLPVFSYLWRANQPATLLSFDEARRAAAEANVELARDPTSRSLHATKADSWELWMTDRDLLRALESEVRALGVDRIALWRLGLEDGEIWASLRP